MKTILAVILLIIIGGSVYFFSTRDKSSLEGVPVSSNQLTIPLETPVLENTQNKPESLTENTSQTNLQNNSNSQKTMENTKYTTATFVTSLGDITITLDQTNTPKTAKNFIKLAEKGFYNGTRFHRVIAGFMIQGGDPLSAETDKKAYWGTGGPGYQFADEIKPTNNNKIGTISMANAGPNTNGSQFFINVANNDFLNTKHTVFGYVTAGMETVNKIALTKVDETDKPVADVIITKIILK